MKPEVAKAVPLAANSVLRSARWGAGEWWFDGWMVDARGVYSAKGPTIGSLERSNGISTSVHTDP